MKQYFMQFVTVYDPNTKTKLEIPVTELAPFMVKGRLDDGSTCWIDRRKIKLNEKPLHPPFSGKRRIAVKELHRALNQVFPRSVNEWERGFRCDQHPDREIRIWQWISWQYRNLVVSGRPDFQRKKDYFRLCLGWSFSKDPQGVLESTQLDEVTRQEAAQIIEGFCRVPAAFYGGQFGALGPDLWAWDYSAIKSLEEFKAKAAAAPVIFAVDWNTGDVECAYGLQTMKDCVEKNEITLSAMFSVDFGTDELEHFLAAVNVTKGKYEWNGVGHSDGPC